MATSWIYLTLIVIISFVALGIFAINTALQRMDTGSYLHTLCDLACKRELEGKGFVCYTGSHANYFCKFKNSAFVTDVVIPWGSSSMPNERNYIPSTITVSLGINSTVQWANVDDAASSVASDDGLFDSGLIKPSMTWTYVFEKVGRYPYHSEPHPWLNGQVIVVPIDYNYNKGRPIENYGGEPPVSRILFREMDEWGYIGNLRMIDSNTITVSLLYPSELHEVKTLRIGDSVLGVCDFVGGHTQIYYLTLERIDFRYGTAEFREDVKIQSADTCPYP